MIVCWVVWNNTAVGYLIKMDKQLCSSFENMAALPAMVGGLSIDVQVDAVRRTLAEAELSVNDTVAINISLEQLVSLAHTVSCLVGRNID